MKVVTAIPIYNEERHVESVLREVKRHSSDILMINDGSTDRTAELLAQHRDITVLTHPKNRGYGAALITAFHYAVDQHVDILVTMDCDGQHQAARIPVLLEALHNADIVSGSRYLRDFRQNSAAPEERRRINQVITEEINAELGLSLTDAFCGFKAYRGAALTRLHATETGWGMPLQVWVQAAYAGLRIKEIGVPRVYLDPNRTFGALNDAEARLAYYRRVIAAALAEARSVACAEAEHGLCSFHLPSGACR